MCIRWLVVVALWGSHVAAQGVHKCVTPGRAVSYQSEPCERGSRDAANWEAPRNPPPSGVRQIASSPQPERERRAEHRSARTGTAHVVYSAPKPSACELAKANRDSTLERVGLKRTFDLLSRLDEQVRNACR